MSSFHPYTFYICQHGRGRVYELLQPAASGAHPGVLASSFSLTLSFNAAVVMFPLGLCPAVLSQCPVDFNSDG